MPDEVKSRLAATVHDASRRVSNTPSSTEGQEIAVRIMTTTLIALAPFGVQGLASAQGRMTEARQGRWQRNGTAHRRKA
jgi:hypothetical protein